MRVSRPIRRRRCGNALRRSRLRWWRRRWATRCSLVTVGLYVRGLLEQGERKSLGPMVARLGGEADYQSMQQFLAVSPWDPVAVMRAVGERVAPEIDVEAWV